MMVLVVGGIRLNNFPYHFEVSFGSPRDCRDSDFLLGTLLGTRRSYVVSCGAQRK